MSGLVVLVLVEEAADLQNDRLVGGAAGGLAADPADQVEPVVSPRSEVDPRLVHVLLRSRGV